MALILKLGVRRAKTQDFFDFSTHVGCMVQKKNNPWTMVAYTPRTRSQSDYCLSCVSVKAA